MRSAVFYGLESSHEDLNSYEFFKLLLTTDIFSFALSFAVFFSLEEFQLFVLCRSIELMFCEFNINHI